MAVYSATYNEGFRGQPEVTFVQPSPFSTQQVQLPFDVEIERQYLLEDCLGAMYNVNLAFLRACLSHNWCFDINVVAHVVNQLNTEYGGWYDAHTERLPYQSEDSPKPREYTYIVIRRRPEPVGQLDFFFAGR
jgi:hypothetical protein